MSEPKEDEIQPSRASVTTPEKTNKSGDDSVKEAREKLK